MSDDFQGPNAGIDAALDSAFDAIGEAKENRQAAISENDRDRVPTALSTNGLWEDAKELAAQKRAAKADKAKADKAAKGETSDKLHKMDVQGRRKAAQEDGLDAALEKATARSSEAQQKRKDERAAEHKGEKPKPLSTKEFNDPETVKHRRELTERFGRKDLSAVMKDFEKWEAEFKKDPVATREKIMNAYLKYSPANFKAPKAGKEGEGISGAVDRAMEGASALQDVQAFAEKYGERLPDVLRQLNEIEKDLIADPVGASARLAANYGATDPKPQQQQLPPPASPEEDFQRVTKGLEGLIHHDKVFPALANDDIAEAVAMVLSHMPRTPDRMADLKTAYGIVVGDAAPAQEPANTNGTKSIHGAPTMGAGRNGAPRRAASLDESISRAFGRG